MVTWKDGAKEVHAYPLEAKEGMEDGGFEIEVVLNEKPDTNVFEFQIEGAEELDFFYQPPLTEEEIAEGTDRPENVVGSYAVYHKHHSNHALGETNYTTGKAYHIYRPKAFDADGVEQWAALHYSDGILSVTVPQEFLEKARYPVRVDPTFGYTSVGASTVDANVVFGNPHTSPSDAGSAALNMISVHGRAVSGSGGMAAALYIGNTLQIGQASTPTVTTSSQWWDVTMSAFSLAASTAYNVETWAQSSAITFRYSFDTCVNCGRSDVTGLPTWPNWDNTLSFATTRDEQFSLYVTYTVAGGGAAPIKRQDVFDDDI